MGCGNEGHRVILVFQPSVERKWDEVGSVVMEVHQTDGPRVTVLPRRDSQDSLSRFAGVLLSRVLRKPSVLEQV